MRSILPKHLPGDFRRSGTVLVMFTVCLIAIMGLLALVIDGGLLQAERIRVQAATDAAALAGARQLIKATQPATARTPAARRPRRWRLLPTTGMRTTASNPLWR